MAPADEELLVACHLTFCPACRTAVAGGEVAAAALAWGRAEAEAPSVSWAAVAARLDDPAPERRAAVRATVPLPRPLVERFGGYDNLPFRAVGGGVRVARLRARAEPGRTFLVDFPPGFRVPDHHHRGVERGLVLRGGYACAGAHFGVGDVDWREAPHGGVQIDDDGRCTALFVADGPPSLGPPWLDGLADRWLYR